jgi:hypothetical protein
MTPQLDYEPKDPLDAPPWSMPAMVGFTLSVFGPSPGVILAVGMEKLIHNNAPILLMIVLLPLAAGIFLSYLGRRQTNIATSPKRGRGLATVGLIMGVAWLGLLLIGFAMS